MDIHPLRQTEYEAYLSLWSQTFGDSRGEIETFLQTFGSDQTAWILVEDGVIASAVTCFLMGRVTGPKVAAGAKAPAGPGGVAGKPAWISYAICTHPSQRGKGFGSRLTAHVRDWVLAQGGLSFLCPAEPSLVEFYRPLGYEPAAFAQVQQGNGLPGSAEETAGGGSFGPPIQVASPAFATAPTALPAALKGIAPAGYQTARERFLAGTPHIALSDRAMAYVALCAMEGAGLLEIDGGQGICACEKEGSHLIIQELLGQGEPAKIAAALGCQTYAVTVPTAPLAVSTPQAASADPASAASLISPDPFVQAMAAGQIAGTGQMQAASLPFWFGFPFA